MLICCLPDAPKLHSVSTSGDIMEGNSVTLNCSGDANPPANYTWYKENEDSPKASGQIFTITDVRPEHSGNYSCEAQNRRGRHNSTLYLTVVTGTFFRFYSYMYTSSHRHNPPYEEIQVGGICGDNLMKLFAS